jgi:quinol monooxygenase YgiN
MTTKPILTAFALFAACTSSSHPTPDAPAPSDNRDVHVGLMVKLEVKAGHEADVAGLLRDGRALVAEEPGTTYWFAIQLGPTTFGIVDAFGTDAARAAHLQGKLAAALTAEAPDLLAAPPVIEPVEVIGRKDALVSPESADTLKLGLVVRMEAKPEHAGDVAALLTSGPSIVGDEPGTLEWFGVRVGANSFAIFDAFADAAGRDAHLNGKLAQMLLAKAPDVLAQAPSISPVDVLAAQIR